MTKQKVKKVAEIVMCGSCRMYLKKEKHGLVGRCERCLTYVQMRHDLKGGRAVVFGMSPFNEGGGVFDSAEVLG